MMSASSGNAINNMWPPDHSRPPDHLIDQVTPAGQVTPDDGTIKKKVILFSNTFPKDNNILNFKQTIDKALEELTYKHQENIRKLLCSFKTRLDSVKSSDRKST